MYHLSFILDSKLEFPSTSPLFGKNPQHSRLVFGKILGQEIVVDSVNVSSYNNSILEQIDIKMARALSDFVERGVLLIKKDNTALDATAVLKLASIYTRT